MSRRGRTGPAISLFAFQDIITSVTAIVIVVVLFLSLDLIQRKQSNPSKSAAALSHAVTARIQQLEIELAKLRRETENADNLVQEVASFSPSELRTQIAQREIALTNLHDSQRSQRQIQLDWQARDRLVNVKKFELEPVRQELEQTLRETQDLGAVLENERREGRTIFEVPRGFNKTGWIGVVESDRITIAQLGCASKPLLFESSGIAFLKTSAANAMSNWIDREHHQSDYFLILIRPDGCRMFDSVEEILQTKRISFGFDVIDTDRVILHPERGAGF